MAELEELSAVLQRAVDEDGIPAAQACVLRHGALVHRSAHGSLTGGQLIDEHTLFDVASVTKAAVTTTITAALLARGSLQLDALASRYLGDPAPDVTVRSLLAHGSGLPPWATLFSSAPFPKPAHLVRALDPDSRRRAFADARAHIIDSVLRTPPEHTPGRRAYSDLGFITLGAVLERVGGARLDTLFEQIVLGPLGLEGPRFFDLATELPTDFPIASTGVTRPRAPAPGQEALYTVAAQPMFERAGEVDDDNAWAMGGIAGHAGLFATAAQLAQIGQAWLEEVHGADVLAAGETLRAFARADEQTLGAERGLGFDRPSGPASTAGAVFGRQGPLGAIGHLGFTGCAMWVDLDRHIVAVLLTNRVRPGREHVSGIRRLRPAYFDAVAMGR